MKLIIILFCLLFTHLTFNSCSSSKNMMVQTILVDDFSLKTRQDDINDLKASKTYEAFLVSTKFLLNEKEISFEEFKALDSRQIHTINIISDQSLIAKFNYAPSVKRIVAVRRK